MKIQESRKGLDVGRTFKNRIYQDENRTIQTVKVPITSINPDQGCINAINEAQQVLF